MRRQAIDRDGRQLSRLLEGSADELAQLLEARAEWLVRERAHSPALCLRRGEWEVRAAAGAVVLSYWGEAGLRVWRVERWSQHNEHLRITASRRTGAVRATLELVPRASAASTAAALRAARRSICDRLARLVSEHSGLAIEAARLSAGARRGEPGRYARIILRRRMGDWREAMVTGPVVPSGAIEPESFLASALLWLARLDARSKTGRELWLVAEAKLAAGVGERLALLRAGLRDRIVLLELDEAAHALKPAPRPSLAELSAPPAPRLSRPRRPHSCELFESLTALAPEAIDLVRSRQGETLRFHGLPFARLRRVAGREMVWFGVGAADKRRPLMEESREELGSLIAELIEHRRADASERRHHIYRAAPEAWLESILRRDITRLDPGLRLAPLYAQFRTTPGAAARATRPVDLLALRHDGRLVVIELKVSEDLAFALQGADYWRRILLQHRAGHIRRARLFGAAKISDDAPLVYLVAPLLRYHRSFETLARCLTPEIEMYRFDLNEDWRGGVRVARRERVE